MPAEAAPPAPGAPRIAPLNATPAAPRPVLPTAPPAASSTTPASITSTKRSNDTANSSSSDIGSACTSACTPTADVGRCACVSSRRIGSEPARTAYAWYRALSAEASAWQPEASKLPPLSASVAAARRCASAASTCARLSGGGSALPARAGGRVGSGCERLVG
eukprot:scaffold32199_cov108-Isochrysis_galbana.AAC.6